MKKVLHSLDFCCWLFLLNKTFILDELISCWPMMHIYGMDIAMMRHRHGRDTDFTHEK